MKISDIKIGVRLGSAFGAVLLLMSAMVAVGIWELSKIAEAKAEMTSTAYKQELAAAWLKGIATNAVRTYAKVRSTTAEDEQFFGAEMKKASSGITEIQKELEGLIASEKGKALLAKVGERRKAYVGIRDTVFKLKADPAANVDDLNNKVRSELMPAMTAYTKSVEDVTVYQKSESQKADATIDEIYAQAINRMAALGAAALVMGALMAWFLSRSITRPLSHAVALAETVAMGDLRSEIDVSSRDEVGQLLAALKRMNESLRSTVIQVHSGTDLISTASQEIAAGNMDLSTRTEQQASSLEETASSMEELTRKKLHLCYGN